MTYPEWFFYPAWTSPPEWVTEFVEIIAGARSQIDSEKVAGLTSNTVLAGFVRTFKTWDFRSKKGPGKVARFSDQCYSGPQGKARVQYQVDGWHPEHRVPLEVEAGPEARRNAVFRDLISASRMVDADFLAIGVMPSYRHQFGGVARRGVKPTCGSVVIMPSATPAVPGPPPDLFGNADGRKVAGHETVIYQASATRILQAKSRCKEP